MLFALYFFSCYLTCISLYLFFNPPTEDFFKTFDPGFALFDQKFNEDFPGENVPVLRALLKGDDGNYLCFESLPDRAKAECLIPILAASCTALYKSPFKHVIQNIFGRLVFHARTSLNRFVVNRKGNLSLLTNEACSHLHGKSLVRLMGVPEEAFVRFVIITDLVRYHQDDIREYSVKYRHLLGDDVYANISALLNKFSGRQESTRPEKGFRNTDISFFQETKKIVSDERLTLLQFLPSVINNKPAVLGEELQSGEEKRFIFHYPTSYTKVKEEADLKDLKSRKRKFMDVSLNCSSAIEAIAMPLDEEDDIVAYDHQHSRITNFFPA